jgi:hypothetical protein
VPAGHPGGRPDAGQVEQPVDLAPLRRREPARVGGEPAQRRGLGYPAPIVTVG